MIFEYSGVLFPNYIKNGNAMAHIAPAALHFCQGNGLDVGCGKWPLPGARGIDLANGGDAMALPEGEFDFVFSSHALEHLANPVAALEHWKSRLKPGGVLFLYLPAADAMTHWRPSRCRKHLHHFRPSDIAFMLADLGFVNIVKTEGWDSYWSFMVVGFVPTEAKIEDRYVGQWAAGQRFVRSDPQLDRLFAHFGADVFRRSAALEDFAGFLNRHPSFRGKRCVEIGSFNGVTALVLARHFDEVVSIDTYPYTMKKLVLEFSGVKNVRFVDVQDNAEKAKIIEGLDFDAAFSDGNHVADTEFDFDLVRRCGRVLFHEYYEQQPPVWHLVNRLKTQGNVETEGKFALWTPR